MSVPIAWEASQNEQRRLDGKNSRDLKAVRPKAQAMERRKPMDGMFILVLSWSFAASSKASSKKEFWTYKDRIVFGGDIEKMTTVSSQYSQSKAPRHLTWRQQILGRASRLPGQSGEDCEAVEASTQVSFKDTMKIPEDPTVVRRHG